MGKRKLDKISFKVFSYYQDKETKNNPRETHRLLDKAPLKKVEMYQSIILFSRHGRLRLSKYFKPLPEKVRRRIKNYFRYLTFLLIFQIF